LSRLWDAPSQSYKMMGPVPPKHILLEYERRFPQDADAVLERKRLAQTQAQAEQDKQGAGARRW
jgi:hypothetical protein